jgi:flagellar motor component MotA
MDASAIAVVGTICGIVFGYIGYISGLKKNSKEEGKESGTLIADTQYIKRRVDDVLLEQRSINTTLSTHTERITRVEESAKQAHKRISECRQQCKPFGANVVDTDE